MDGSAEQRSDEWGPFGRPLFEDPSARALSRVGVVDVGSNSVRMVVFDGAARSPAYFFNEKLMCGLGAGLGETGHLNPEGRRRALSALRRFALLAEGMGATPLTVVATAAVRDATDGPEFRKEIEAETGLKLWVIDGEEEARLSAQGVLLGWPGADGLVCDIGGSSLELAELSEGRVGKRVTSALGPLKLRDIKGGKKGLTKYIAATMNNLAEKMGTGHKRLFLVGGSWRAIARLDMDRRGYPLLVQHEYKMTRQSISETIKWIADKDLSELRARTGISADRMALVPIACQVLKQLLSTLKPKEIFVSSYGIREGLLYEQMPERLRQRDPLIEACRFAEASSARIPGFGRRLYNFVSPLFSSVSDERKRLIKAACLLHDTAWRAHPDYRHEVCFDNATRANLGGLDHEGRVFLGLALLHRYKNNRSGSRFEPLFGLLSERQLKDAEVLGKAMRFGAMFSSEAPDQLAELRYFPKMKKLELRLTPGSEGLFGEVAEARFASLAKALDVETNVKTKRVTKRG
ncbi:Ppx/GppA family phosphatase [Actibacterium lipolyticum]|uniref:Guanosine-5'-triphosphate,3'-diphosphate pyrophosphatase n=1 Tax=Actibacterium lipolyticum TaxID=1524263 RepID=A0A238JPY1_9RHOB|nr:Ppx/GppA family phosphatase [Actibacterium lipolyticum]SMX32711.1 Guanosine-5'-triphosphate,3'-diphosphate pyrophosphatase [Actibacterium lipolyticum]